jgi:hypothetical protein
MKSLLIDLFISSQNNRSLQIIFTLILATYYITALSQDYLLCKRGRGVYCGHWLGTAFMLGLGWVRDLWHQKYTRFGFCTNDRYTTFQHRHLRLSLFRFKTHLRGRFCDAFSQSYGWVARENAMECEVGVWSVF